MSNKGSQTRQKIIEKSLHLFSIKGYYNTSINDILEATNLTKGGLYGHFPSKELIWYAVYDEAVRIWRSLVFKEITDQLNPISRIEKIIENDIEDYLGGDVFEGGCFFLNMLLELSGQSASMSKTILRGFVRFSRLMRKWLEEADKNGLLKPGPNYKDIANFIVITLNGAAALYTSSRDRNILKQTSGQLGFYLNQLKK